MYAWSERRCPCCYKKTRTELGPSCNETAAGWDNFMPLVLAERLARAGTCPWCGRTTTIVSRILMQRFAPTAARYERGPL